MFRYGQWRFLALNTSDVSLHAWPKNSDKDKTARKLLQNYTQKKNNAASMADTVMNNLCGLMPSCRKHMKIMKK